MRSGSERITFAKIISKLGLTTRDASGDLSGSCHFSPQHLLALQEGVTNTGSLF